jgi:hypothetical protein
VEPTESVTVWLKVQVEFDPETMPLASVMVAGVHVATDLMQTVRALTVPLVVIPSTDLKPRYRQLY